MKFIGIVMLIFMLNVALSLTNALGYFTTGAQVQPQQAWMDQVNEQAIQDEEYFQNIATQDTSNAFGFGDFLKGLALFISTFAKGTIAPAYILTAFGVPTWLAILLSLPIYPIYLLGIAQFISNRGAKSME